MDWAWLVTEPEKMKPAPVPWRFLSSQPFRLRTRSVIGTVGRLGASVRDSLPGRGPGMMLRLSGLNSGEQPSPQAGLRCCRRLVPVSESQATAAEPCRRSGPAQLTHWHVQVQPPEPGEAPGHASLTRSQRLAINLNNGAHWQAADLDLGGPRPRQ